MDSPAAALQEQENTKNPAGTPRSGGVFSPVGKCYLVDVAGVFVDVVLVVVALVGVMNVPGLVPVVLVGVALMGCVVVGLGVVLVGVALVGVVHVAGLVAVVLVGIALVNIVKLHAL